MMGKMHCLVARLLCSQVVMHAVLGIKGACYFFSSFDLVAGNVETLLC